MTSLSIASPPVTLFLSLKWLYMCQNFLNLPSPSVSYNSFIFISLSFWAVFWVNSSELSSNSQILSLTMTNVVFTQYCFICSYLYILIPYYSTAAELQSTSFCSRIWLPAMENFIFLLNMNCTKMSTLIYSTAFPFNVLLLYSSCSGYLFRIIMASKWELNSLSWPSPCSPWTDLIRLISWAFLIRILSSAFIQWSPELNAESSRACLESQS